MDPRYPLIYHMRVDDYLPNEEFEPHLFEHIPEWQRPRPRPSLPRRLGSLLARVVRAAHASRTAPTVAERTLRDARTGW